MTLQGRRAELIGAVLNNCTEPGGYLLDMIAGSDGTVFRDSPVCQYDPSDTETGKVLMELGTSFDTECPMAVVPDDDGEGFTLLQKDGDGFRREQQRPFRGSGHINGLSNLSDFGTVMIVPGEPDRLLMEELGIPAVSVNGQWDTLKDELRRLKGENGTLPVLGIFIGNSREDRDRRRGLVSSLGDVTARSFVPTCSELGIPGWIEDDGFAPFECFRLSCMHGHPEALKEYVTKLNAKLSFDEACRRDPVLRSAVSAKIMEKLGIFLSGEGPGLLPTGLDSLDRLLRGGMDPNCIHVIAAESSIGKTSAAMQIAANMAKCSDVFYVQLDDHPDNFYAKFTSQEAYRTFRREKKIYGNKRPDDVVVLPRTLRYKADTMNGDMRELVEKIGRRISEGPSPLYLTPDSGDLGFAGHDRINTAMLTEAVSRHRKEIGPERNIVLFIDYLQLLRPEAEPSELARMSDKEKLDRVMQDIREMRTRYGVTVVAISAVNRESYSSPLGISALKESGEIEYAADYIYVLQPAGLVYPGDGCSEAEAKRTNAEVYRRFRETPDGEPRYVEMAVKKGRLMKLDGTELVNDPRYGIFEDTPEYTAYHSTHLD
ncbi:MAG: DnaB helicase C-terminal domain-containing protein [archaeon]|nr:DnaB helicase C-terminal domain-containing protein [archaeon]